MNSMDEKHEATLFSEMRKLLASQGQSAKDYGEPMLRRFLLASSMDPVKATKMVIKWKKWREEFVPLGYVSESDIIDQLEAKSAYLQGLSTKGHPVCILQSRKYVPSKDKLKYKKFLVHLFDKTIASYFKEGKEIGNEKIVAIVDMYKMSYKNVDIREVSISFQILQGYYKDRLEKVFIVGMPRFFVRIWKMTSYLLDKPTLDRFVIVENEDERKNIIEEIGIDTLPEEYGGRAKLIPIQDVRSH